MYNEKQIQDLVLEKLVLEREFNSKKKFGKTDAEVPPFTPVYQESVEMAEKIKVHSRYGVFPEKLFREKAPFQDPKEFEYQKKNYPKPSITMPYWMEALGVINRIWNDSNWSIKWNNFEENSVYKDAQPQDYFEKQYPSFGSYEAFKRQIYTDYKINDPNAISCYKPHKIPVKEGLNDKGEPIMVYDDTIMVEPKEYIYDSDQQWDYIEGDRLLIYLHEKSIIEDGDKKVRKGRMFEFYDKQNIWRVIQVGKKQDDNYSCELYYSHNLGILPCEKLKGRPVSTEGYIIYQSYFLPAVGLLDEAVKNGSTKQLSIYANAFPRPWEFVDPCDNPQCGSGCERGYIVDYVNDVKSTKICPTCQGSGDRTKNSVLGVYKMKVPGRLDGEGDAAIPTPPFGFVAPGTEILEFLKKEVKDNIIDGFEILNITVSKSEVRGSDTALGKQIDREEMFSFILKISDEVFESFEFGLKVMGLMRYGLKANGEPNYLPSEISYPKTFLIRSEYDILTEVNEAKKAEMPDIVIRQLIQEFINLRFGANKNFNSVTGLAFQIDRLAILSQVDINAGISLNKIARWEAVLHDSVYQFIEEALIKDPLFLEKEFQIKKNTLIQMAKSMADAIAPPKDNTADELFNSINGQS
jgi:hypothetical protein